MKALTWHGTHDVRVDTVPDPRIEHPTDAIVRVTSTGICGSDLHLYEVLGPYLDAGDILGHEPMGVVEEVGAEVTHIAPGDRVVIPFNISCGHCFMCDHGLQSQCETTQVREYGTGAALLGYTKLYGQVPGGQAEFVRVPQAQYGPIKVPEGPPDDRFVYLSDVLPTAWQAVEYADVPGRRQPARARPRADRRDVLPDRAAPRRRARCIGIDLVPERLERARVARRHRRSTSKSPRRPRRPGARATNGRGPDAVIDAVGMEAHGAPFGKLAHRLAGLLPDAAARKLIETAGIDRLSAVHLAIELVRRGGTISLSGVYGGAISPMPLLQLFDKQVTLRMGQANVRRWVDDLLPLLCGDDDPLGVEIVRHAPSAARRGAARPTRSSRRSRTGRSRCC